MCNAGMTTFVFAPVPVLQQEGNKHAGVLCASCPVGHPKLHKPRKKGGSAWGRTQLDLGAACEEAEALGVAGVADGDVHSAAGVHRKVVHRRAALVRVHMPCQVPRLREWQCKKTGSKVASEAYGVVLQLGGSVVKKQTRYAL